MAIFLSYEFGFSARFSSAKLHKIVDICKKNRNYFIDNQLFILNFSIDYIITDSLVNQIIDKSLSNDNNIDTNAAYSDIIDMVVPY